jgi:hypothetical protein
VAGDGKLAVEGRCGEREDIRPLFHLILWDQVTTARRACRHA